MNRDEQKAMKTLGNVATNKQAASTLGQKTLDQELKEVKGAAASESALGSKMAAKMQADKDKFIAKHKIKKG